MDEMETEELKRALGTVELVEFDPPDLPAVRRDARRIKLQRRAPFAAGALAAAIVLPIVIVAQHEPAGEGTHVENPAGPPSSNPASTTKSPQNRDHQGSQQNRHHEHSNGVAEPWPPSTPVRPIDDARVDSDIERTGLRSSKGREALLFAVSASSHNDAPDVLLGYRDGQALMEVTPVFAGVDVDRRPWMSFNAFSAGAVGDGWVTYGYVADSRVKSVRIVSTDGSIVRATWGRPDAVVEGARMFWARGTGTRVAHFELLDANGAVIEQCDYFECPQ